MFWNNPRPIDNEEPVYNTCLLTIARVGFAGKSPKAPGTVGSLVAIVLCPLLFMPLSLPGRLLVLAFLFWLGVHAASAAEQMLQKPDASEIVIDEFVGQWLVCLPFAHLGFWSYALAFGLFRLFDITKPWPVSRCEEFPGGLGVMLDDIMAGILAMLCLGLVHLL